MSKYVILRLNNKLNPYAGCQGKPFYELFNHTITKYANNEPYFSANVSINKCNKYAVSLEQLPQLFKLAQNHIPYYNKSKESKKGKIFVLKLNSPKLKEIINLYK